MARAGTTNPGRARRGRLRAVALGVGVALTTALLSAGPTAVLAVGPGGTNVQQGQYPFVGRLLTLHPGPVPGVTDIDLCTASLVAPSWALTAYHCLRGGTGQVPAPDARRDLAVSFGGTRLDPDLKDPGGFQVLPTDVRDVRAVDGYLTYGYHRDVALLHLATPVTDIAPVVLASPFQSTSWDKDSRAYVVGWGPNAYVGGTITQLRGADQRVADATFRYCYGRLTKCLYDEMAVVPAAPASGRVLGGDSGAPLLADELAGPVQIGVLSGGYKGKDGFVKVGVSDIATRLRQGMDTDLASSVVVPGRSTVTVTVLSQSAAYSQSLLVARPAFAVVCQDCRGGETATLPGTYEPGTPVEMSYNLRTAGPPAVRITGPLQSGPGRTAWICYGEDQNPVTGDFDDLVWRVEATDAGAPPAPASSALGPASRGPAPAPGATISPVPAP